MPNYFRLINRETNEGDKFADIDDKICAHLGVAPHPEKFYESWYDLLGLDMATGASWQMMRERWNYDKTLIRIVDYLEERYRIEAWYSAR